MIKSPFQSNNDYVTRAEFNDFREFTEQGFDKMGELITTVESNLTKRMIKIETKVGRIEERVGGLETKVDSLSGRVDTLTTQMGTLTVQVKDLTVLTTNLTVLTTKIANKIL